MSKQVLGLLCQTLKLEKKSFYFGKAIPIFPVELTELLTALSYIVNLPMVLFQHSYIAQYLRGLKGIFFIQ